MKFSNTLNSQAGHNYRLHFTRSSMYSIKMAKSPQNHHQCNFRQFLFSFVVPRVSSAILKCRNALRSVIITSLGMRGWFDHNKMASSRQNRPQSGRGVAILSSKRAPQCNLTLMKTSLPSPPGVDFVDITQFCVSFLRWRRALGGVIL